MDTALLELPRTVVPDIDDDLTRRRLLSGIGALGLSVTLAGCAEDEDAPGASASVPGASPTPTGAFPVRIDHKYGSTEIPAEPARVVSVGLRDQDAILALGVAPVGVRDWFGDQPFATWPWAQDALGDAEPEVLANAELAFESIAALRPELIIGLSASMTRGEYERLSQIAPTVVEAAGRDFGTPWQEQTRVIGRALGRSARAEELVTDVEGRFSEAREQHPEFEGASAAIGDAGDPAVFYLYGPQRNEVRFLTSLGFTATDVDVGEDLGSGVIELSAERLDVVDTDLLLWYARTSAEPEHLASAELYQQLTVAMESRDLFLGSEDPLAGAIAFSSVLSLPYAIDRLVPMLAAAVDGDPATIAAAPTGGSPAPAPSAIPTS